MVEKKENFKCGICNNSFPTEAKLLTHQKEKHKPCEVAADLQGNLCREKPMFSVVLWQKGIRMCQKHKEFYEKGAKEVIAL